MNSDKVLELTKIELELAKTKMTPEITRKNLDAIIHAKEDVAAQKTWNHAKKCGWYYQSRRLKAYYLSLILTDVQRYSELWAKRGTSYVDPNWIAGQEIVWALQSHNFAPKKAKKMERILSWLGIFFHLEWFNHLSYKMGKDRWNKTVNNGLNYF